MANLNERISKLKVAAPKLGHPKLGTKPGPPEPEAQRLASIENCGVRLNNALAKAEFWVARAEAIALELEGYKKEKK